MPPLAPEAPAAPRCGERFARTRAPDPRARDQAARPGEQLTCDEIAGALWMGKLPTPELTIEVPRPK